MTLAGAVAVWYFNHGRGHYVTPVSTGLWNAFRYHLGSAAVGSFVLALVQFIKWWLRFLAKQSQAQGNVVLARIAACLSYCVACFERVIKFLNKNAYIQCAISGKNFCTSAREAFSLIVRNAGRYVAVGAVTTMLQLLGILFITGGTGASGYFILKAIHPEVAPWFCFAFYLIMGYVVSRLCMNVYSIAVSSALVCFIMDGERNSEPLHAPKEMLTFYKNRKSRLSHVSKK
jgi:solute carrier family 44 protein 1 (choline transporter-like protein)/choline transporter-like protein 2/4/5